MVIENVWQFLFVVLAVYGAAELGAKFQRWVNS